MDGLFFATFTAGCSMEPSAIAIGSSLRSLWLVVRGSPIECSQRAIGYLLHGPLPPQEPAKRRAASLQGCATPPARHDGMSAVRFLAGSLRAAVIHTKDLSRPAPIASLWRTGIWMLRRSATSWLCWRTPVFWKMRARWVRAVEILMR